MSLKKTLSVTIAALVLIVAACATAQPKDSRTVLVHYAATIAGTHLASGSYDIALQTHTPQATVTFSHGKKVVATAEGKVEDRGTRYAANEIVYEQAADGSRVIHEIRFRDSSQVIVFNE
jgi:hypothetical protein